MSKKKHEEEKQNEQEQALESESPQKTDAEIIAELNAEIESWKDKYLRSLADFENLRRRTNQEKADWIRLATEKLALGVCDVMDNFERALMQVPEDMKDNGYMKGILLIEQQLRNVLEKDGVKKLEALGQEFDPKFHEALAHFPSEYEENIVAAVIQNGYSMHDKVIRPVRVAVSSGLKEELKQDNKE